MSSWDPDEADGFGDEEIPGFEEVSELQGSVREETQEYEGEQVQEENDVFARHADWRRMRMFPCTQAVQEIAPVPVVSM